ncbi:hypothetical protein [Helicobacter pylori]|uniref:hypothetical protein n=1 Tax=Helicobacter pylori TaxID=210 RepID=UPI001E4CAB73|nr:hypothetical protein [Helicobacter pylori]
MEVVLKRYIVIYRISHTVRITLSMDNIERWEKEHLEQGLGNSFKPKKKKKTKPKKKKKKKTKPKKKKKKKTKPKKKKKTKAKRKK